MVFQVTMSEKEAQQMLEDKQNRKHYEIQSERLQELAHKVLTTFEELSGNYFVKDDQAVAELVEMAAMYIE